MIALRRASLLLLVLAALATAGIADAQPGASAQDAAPVTALPAKAAQGVAVVGTGALRDEAFTLARTVYGSSLRPRRLDELRARILAGDPAPPSAAKELRELAELRAGVTGEDAASRRLLASIAEQLGVQALLVVSRAPVETPSPATPADESARDAGAPAVEAPADTAPGPADAGAPPVAAAPRVQAQLFLADSGEFDAARYEPDALGWRGTVTSLSRRFPPPPAAKATAQLYGAPPKLPSEGKESQPFYRSPWVWGAVGAAVLLGGFFFFASQDTSDDPIHLQMRVPR
ncbi:MAG: hypothetical protein KF795_31290 [Labilithrix sp.]|nr:hypothetical protein [Labilithrix sp.]